jgi:MoaA/NifB/PqqE/SkfB family radical SAM enzyme
MELPLVKKIVDEISEKKIVTRINLHLMGEPTLHPKLNEILAYAKNKDVKVDLTTNGSTLVKKRVPMLLDNISGSIVASLMTPTKETYKTRGDVGLSWDRYVDNFRLLIQEHLKKILRGDKIDYEIVFRVMVSNNEEKGKVRVLESSKSVQENYEEWSNFTETVEKELGLKSFARETIDPKKIFSLLENEIREVGFYLQKNIKIQFWRAFTFANTRVDEEYKLEAQEKAQFCPHPFTDFGVLWNGDVSLCCLDYDATLKVGNVKTQSVEDVINGTASKKLRASMYGLEKLHPTCVKCQSQAVKR